MKYTVEFGEWFPPYFSLSLPPPEPGLVDTRTLVSGLSQTN